MIIARACPRDKLRVKTCMRKAENILPEEYNAWSEGGCRILARSLARLTDGEVWTVLRENQPQHYYMQKEGCLYDYNGASDANRFPAQFRRDYFEKRQVTLVHREIPSSEIPEDILVEKRLEDFLKTCMVGKKR